MKKERCFVQRLHTIEWKDEDSNSIIGSYYLVQHSKILWLSSRDACSLIINYKAKIIYPNEIYNHKD